MTQMSVRKGAIASLVLLTVIGCSPTASGGPTGAASGRPVGSDGPSGPAATFHAAPDLEARMPVDAGGVALTIESVAGTGFESSRPHRAGMRCRWYPSRGLRCRDQAGLADLLGRLGKAPGDVSIAVAYDQTRGKIIEVQGLRIAGTTGNQILEAQIALEREQAATGGRALDATSLDLAGRTLTLIRSARTYPLGTARYLMASGDVLYEIRKTDETTLEAVLGQLG